MDTYVLIGSILFSFYFIVKSLKEPIYLIFVLAITETNFFGSISPEQAVLFSRFGITIYYSDLVLLIILTLIINKIEFFGSLPYTSFFRNLILVFILMTIFRFLVFLTDFYFQDLKNFWRIFLRLFIPFFIYYYYDSTKHEWGVVKGFAIITVISLVVFFLEYFGLYSKFDLFTNRKFEDLTLSIKETGSILKRNPVLGGVFSYAAPSLLLLYYFKEKKRYLILISVITVIVFFLSTYRAAFITVALSTFIVLILSLFINLRKNNVLSYTLAIFIVLILLIQQFTDWFDTLSSFYRVISAISEIKYQEGTGFVRLYKTAEVYNILIKHSEILLIGSYFTGYGRSLSEFISGDLGIIATVAQFGLIFSIILIYFILKIIFSNQLFPTNKGLFVKIIRIYLIAFLPSLIFNFEPFLYFVNHFVILIGFAFAEQKVNRARFMN